MVWSLRWKDDALWSEQKFFRPLWDLKIHYCVLDSLTFTLPQAVWLKSVLSYPFFGIHFNTECPKWTRLMTKQNNFTQLVAVKIVETRQVMCLWQLVTPLSMRDSFQLVCEKWRHSHNKRNISVLTGWQKLNFHDSWVQVSWEVRAWFTRHTIVPYTVTHVVPISVSPCVITHLGFEYNLICISHPPVMYDCPKYIIVGLFYITLPDKE